MTTAFIFLVLVGLLLVGMPVSIALGLTVLTVLFTLTDAPLSAVALKLFTGIEHFELMCVPFFIVAGNFMTHGGVARRMIRFATSMVGHWPGGLGLAAVVACAIFAALSGSSPATVVAIGSIMIPAMVARGYPKSFSAGVVASSGALGILIPPSIVMVLYSVATSGMAVVGADGKRIHAASVDDLFMAGVVPGLVLAALLALTTVWLAWRRGYPATARQPWSERLAAFVDCFWGLALIVIVMGGIYGGVFTPTEAAAVSAVYAFVVAVFIYRDLPLSAVPRVLLQSASMSAMLLYIITNAVLFTFLLTHEQIPQAMADWLIHQGFGPITFLLVVNVILLAAGCIMEPASVTLILAPILFPVAARLGIDPVHFGIIMVVNMEIGMITPPVGLNLYVASGISRLGLMTMSHAVVPWLCTMVAFLMVVTFWPDLSLALPRWLGML
ncbi:MAG: TRAP transporter large permease subunit [Hyphomicrobium sp.]|uniref:TRAP transporter large permease n=1 Tax=Hyphomicrobium sp. TaxID=82 RepID=UPI0025C25DF3|nr:TRAP transporter large permease subunit [Hyphomicrobium sp.]MBX9862228.1 TRAP transporter large permease subunit [Hyphomicrobium sp.]